MTLRVRRRFARNPSTASPSAAVENTPERVPEVAIKQRINTRINQTVHVSQPRNERLDARFQVT